MRGPWQVGDLPGPVSSGYLSVGVVEEGPDDLAGRRVFSLHPHQSHYVLPASAVTPVPEGVPDHRAVLAGTVETAVNALWTPRHSSATGSRSSGAGWSACAWPGCSPASRASR